LILLVILVLDHGKDLGVVQELLERPGGDQAQTSICAESPGSKEHFKSEIGIELDFGVLDF